MITIQQDGNKWGAFDCIETYPESDAYFALQPADALHALADNRPDLAEEQVIRWEDGYWWPTIAEALAELEGAQ